MYAGAASGGVHKTEDGGNSWIPLWHDQESLAIGALGLCRTAPDEIWAATGEVRDGVHVAGKGVYRSSDGGGRWRRASADPPTPPIAALEHAEALAVNPLNPEVCWIAAENGVYRTIDGGAHWTLFAATTANSTRRHHFSDVVYGEDGGTIMLYLVGRPSNRGEAEIIRLTDPDPAPGAPPPAPGAATGDTTINTALSVAAS